MTGREPPFDPNSNSRNNRSPSTSISSGTGKSSWKSSSYSPSQSANNGGGFDITRYKLRSVLTHPLGLPLLFAFHDEETDKMKYLPQTRTQFNQEQIKTLDGLFQKAVEGTENKQDENEVKEKPITERLTALINEQCETLKYGALSEVSIKDDNNQKKGVMDIILTHDENKNQAFETPPLAVLEFGLNAGDWWSKFHQGTLYIEMMMNLALQNLTFDQPILLMIVTIDKTKNSKIVSESNFRMGVFLCVPKGGNSAKGDRYRISLLWHSQTNSLSNASVLFGKFLRITADFASWRNEHQSPSGYEYFSSNCCKVATRDIKGEETAMVLRSYDNRGRKTDRNPEIYLTVKELVGNVEVVFGDTNFGNHNVDEKEPPNQFEELLNQPSQELEEKEELWTRSSEDLLIIAVPYRDGRHYAVSPADFLPIIDQLQALHREGFVHGDIRAYNIVFKDDEKGWLIDFDFGGKSDVQPYPKGYRQSLNDGTRMGVEGKAITKYHDWFALGKLMFSIHSIPADAEYNEMSRLEKYWTPLEEDWCTDKNIEALKDFLGQFIGKTITMKLHPRFGAAVKENTTKAQITKKGATGKPPNQFEEYLDQSSEDLKEREEFWTRSSQDLLIIAVPYRDGRHYAKSPADFLPIIDQLQALHKAGFVHGDIRAFNTVFKDYKEGWLIDFDFGGRSDVQTYPTGYRTALVDGTRMGEERETITKYHDWYALGMLMFTIHKIPADALTTVEMFRLKDRWILLKEQGCTEKDIDTLKAFLQQFIGKTTTMKLDPPFGAAVKENTTKAQITKKGATGSPLQ
ncbi:phosphotransferase enzyme family protein [Nitzschia inconspicua]|uniref:Phosphotransferase enzyme family protein n=1 Tax=Nitzschia inconspicua TaxID=303405 RepID=A0A9K3KCJ4_9STRA|nr:phosphotransferase enzyme family protein [Nitzschia inconspicua]